MSSPSSSQFLQPPDYAYQWCNQIIGELGECKRGVDYASANLTSLSPGQVIQNCTNSTSIDGFSTSDAFRYGCYLNAAFQGPVANLCSTSLVGGSGSGSGSGSGGGGGGAPVSSAPVLSAPVSSAPVSSGPVLSVSMPCAATCQTVYGGSSSSSSSSGKVDVCTKSAQNQFNSSVQNGKCGNPSEMLSCINGLFQSGSGFNCEQNSSDFENTCKPSVIGCVLGSLQSGCLNQIQNYQKQNGMPMTSCSSLMYSNPSNITGPSNQPNPPNTPDSNWNPWPDGSTYS